MTKYDKTFYWWDTEDIQHFFKIFFRKRNVLLFQFSFNFGKIFSFFSILFLIQNSIQTSGNLHNLSNVFYITKSSVKFNQSLTNSSHSFFIFTFHYKNKTTATEIFSRWISRKFLDTFHENTFIQIQHTFLEKIN
jgi:hypothetical protein